MIQKIEAAIFLAKSGLYRKVATVESSLLKESFEMTTTSKTPWYLNNNRKIALLTGKAERDSMAGDILEMDGVKYLVLPLGMVNIKTKEWV